MLNEVKCIIVWNIRNGLFIYSLTNDGGVNWTEKSQLVDKKRLVKEIQRINYSADGQATIAFSEKYFYESNRKRPTFIQSNNFGHSFQKLK